MIEAETFSMPPEWAPQSATWLSWPHNLETWPTNLAAAQAEFVQLVQQIADHQQVMILCCDSIQPHARVALQHIRDVQFVAIPTNDAWARDYAPTFVKHSVTGKLVAVNWHYNAWGGKYPPYDLDQQVATRIAQHLGIDLLSPELCLEGGAIEIDQDGLLLTTRSCVLNPNRNPGKSTPSIETTLKQSLGAKQILWISGDAIEGDDTDGHIDQLARFTSSHSIVYAWQDHDSDSQYPGLAANLRELKQALANGAVNHELIALPLPPRIDFCGRRIPASYCNFLITNQKVIVPQFGSKKHDRNALAILANLFPDRETVGLDSLNLAVGLGSFHCLSQQQPA